MRTPKLEEYEPEKSRFELEDIDVSGVEPIKPRSQVNAVEQRLDDETERISERKTERISERTDFRTEKQTERLPIKRVSRRYSFEFYDDQLAELKRLKREAEDRGERLTLSDMARQAMDDYLRSRLQETERISER